MRVFWSYGPKSSFFRRPIYYGYCRFCVLAPILIPRSIHVVTLHRYKISKKAKAPQNGSRYQEGYQSLNEPET